MIEAYIQKVGKNLANLKAEKHKIDQISRIMFDTLVAEKKIMFCGNGGSAADAQHLAAEFMGRFLVDRKPLPALSLTVDTSAITAIGNDYGFDKVFSRQLRGIGQSGDILVAISTSGNSVNVIDAIQSAREKDITTIGLTGNGGGQLADLCDVSIVVQAVQTNHIQEMHIVIGHLLCAIVEKQMVEFNREKGLN